MLRPGGVACFALARAFTTKLSWAGSPQKPTLVMTEWLIVIYHCRTFTGRTDSLMGSEQRTQRSAQRDAKANFFAAFAKTFAPSAFNRACVELSCDLATLGSLAVYTQCS